MPDPSFAYGTARLKPQGNDLGAYLASYAAWLNAKLDEGVYYVVFEAPIYPKFSRIETLRQLYGLCAVTELIAHQRGIKCREAAIPKVRKFLCNDGHAKKQQVFDVIKRIYKYSPQTTDEADAIAIRMYVIGHERVDLLKTMRADLGALGA